MVKKNSPLQNSWFIQSVCGKNELWSYSSFCLFLVSLKQFETPHRKWAKCDKELILTIYVTQSLLQNVTERCVYIYKKKKIEPYWRYELRQVFLSQVFLIPILDELIKKI